MRLSNVRRIIIEDFSKEDRETVSKLATILNSFMEEVVDLANGNIDYDNLARTKITADLTVDANGVPVGVSQINTGLASFSGSKILNVQSLSGGANVTSAPYLDASNQGSGIIRIIKIYGIPANKKVRITFEFIA